MPTAPPTPDAVLVRRLRARERGAWDELYAAYQPRLRAFAYRLAGDPHDADDLVQETFVRAVPRLDQLDPDTADVQAYLFTTLRNLFLKQVERGKRTQPVAEVPEPIAPTPIEDDPERSTLLAAQVHEMRVANGRLDSRQRLVLALRELEERSYAEIGEIVGLNENAVAQLIYRARESLRIELRLAQVDPESMPEECRAFLPQLAAHLDGELKGKRGEKAMAHLAGCERCQSALADMEEASRRYRTLFPPLLATGYDEARAATSEALEETGYWESSPSRPAGGGRGGAARLGRHARLVLAAAGLLALGGGGAGLAVALGEEPDREAVPTLSTAASRAPTSTTTSTARPVPAAATTAPPRPRPTPAKKPEPKPKPKPATVAAPAPVETTTAATPATTTTTTTTATDAPPPRTAVERTTAKPPVTPKKPAVTTRPKPTTTAPPKVARVADPKPLPDPKAVPDPKPPPAPKPPKDTTAPTVQITSAPAPATSSADASIAFSASEASATFACRVDGGAAAPCASPFVLAGLAPGAHSLAVRATDAAGNAGPEATVQWTFTPPDTTAPTVTITTDPPASTTDTSATVTFTADEEGVAFACALDGAVPAACTSPAAFAGLAVGAHQVSITATDAAGNVGAAATASWTVVAPLPDLRIGSLTRNAIVVTNGGTAAAAVPSVLTITLVGTFTVPALAPGASVTLTWSICRVGTYSAILDRTGVVAESDETNNRASLVSTCQ